MCRVRKKTWFGRLMDKDDRTTAMSNFITFVIIGIAAILLLVPAFALGIESWFNHTVASDISGWSAYIASVSTLIATICGMKWGINYTDRKFPIQDPYEDDYNGTEQQINE